MKHEIGDKLMTYVLREDKEVLAAEDQVMSHHIDYEVSAFNDLRQEYSRRQSKNLKFRFTTKQNWDLQ